jgi:type I restriction enzyme S subunit
LISVRAPVGPTNVADIKCCIGRGLAAIRPRSDIDRDFILAALRFYEGKLAELGSGSTYEAIKREDLESLQIPLPPLAEQKRIAAILNEQVARVERARAAAKAQLKATKALPPAYLRAVFNSADAKAWPRKRFGDICELLPAKSIATDGDTNVLAITTACLSEIGFEPSGVKPAKMWARDAAKCMVSPGEVLIARSNTPDLVGRVSMFSGNPNGAVASDLTIRIRPRDNLESPFLTAYLSFLYLSGYWKGRAGGASGTMKKITRTQILDEQIPLPSRMDQQHMMGRLSDQMASVEQTRKTLEERLETINKLPAALLRRVFSGEL